MKEKIQFQKNNAKLTAFFHAIKAGRGGMIRQKQNKIFLHPDHEIFAPPRIRPLGRRPRKGQKMVRTRGEQGKRKQSGAERAYLLETVGFDQSGGVVVG